MARVAKIITPETPVASKRGRALPVIIVLAILLMLAVAIAGYFYYQYRNSAPVKDAEEITDLTKKIGAVMELPEGEAPTLATVTDKDKLAEQPFFQKAENGDKVLIYTNNGRAILYRPSTGKIVDVTTVNVNTPAPVAAPVDAPAPQTTEAAPAPVPTPENQNVKVALYNGSTKIGVTNTLEDEIKAKFGNVEVAIKDRAVKNDYQGNLVVDLSGKNADLAKSIAESFAGTVGALPAGETAPTDTDILIIVGNK